jgi:hypothetical protein
MQILSQSKIFIRKTRHPLSNKEKKPIHITCYKEPFSFIIIIVERLKKY